MSVSQSRHIDPDDDPRRQFIRSTKASTDDKHGAAECPFHEGPPPLEEAERQAVCINDANYMV